MRTVYPVVNTVYAISTDGLSDVTIDLASGSHHRITPTSGTAAFTIADAISNMIDGAKCTIEIAHDSATAATVTWGSGFQFADGVTPTLGAKGEVDFVDAIVTTMGGTQYLSATHLGTFAAPAAPPSGLVNTHCASFGGGYLEAADTADHDFAGGSGNSFSISMWVKPATVTADETLASKYNGTGWNLGITTAGGFNFSIWQGGSGFWYDVPSSGLTTARWHHVAAIFDDVTTGSARVYVDGAEVTGAGKSGYSSFSGNASNSANFRLGGRDASSTVLYSGKLDCVSIWSKALSASEVVALYGASVPTDIASEVALESWYRFKSTDDLTGTADGVEDDKGSAKLTGSGSVALTADPASGLAHWWKLNDSASAPADSGFSALALTGNGDPTLTGDDSIEFDGAGSPMDNLSLSSCTTIVAKERTFSFWLKLDASATPATYDMYFNAHKNAWYAGGFSLWQQSSQLKFAVGGYGDIAYIANPAADTWAHVVCVCSYSAGVHEIYLNKAVGTTGGTPVDPTTDGSSTAWIAGEDFSLGAASAVDATYGFVGELADFRIFDRALTLADITVIYDAGRGN